MASGSGKFGFAGGGRRGSSRKPERIHVPKSEPGVPF
nr:MAG TPA: hypothetical protein [Caudoviricetes sp.]